MGYYLVTMSFVGEITIVVMLPITLLKEEFF